MGKGKWKAKALAAPTSDGDALLAAVIANPDEDTPRLVHADWLQENGQPERAEFIRLHIEWCRRPIDALPNEDLKQRLSAAWDRGAETWRKDFVGVTHVYDRGFVAGVETRHFTGFWNAPGPFGACAPVQFASIGSFDGPDEAKQILVSPCFARLTGFGCWRRHGMDADFVRTLFAHPHAAAVRVLDINGCDDTPAATYRALAAATGLTGLQVLDVGGGDLEDAELEAILSAKQFASLVSLRLGHDHHHGSDCTNPFTEDGLAAFSRASHLVNLKQLDISADDDRDGVIERLLKWEHVGQLTELSLKYATTEKEIRTLARSRKLQNLRRLELGSLSSGDARALLQAKHLDNLREVYWYMWNGDGDEELATKMDKRFGTVVPDFEFSVVCDEDRISRLLRCLFLSTPGESRML